MEILHLTFQSYCTRIFTQTVTNVANVDLRCTEYTHETLNGATLSTIVDAGGIDGQLYLENKTVVFVQTQVLLMHGPFI